MSNVEAVVVKNKSNYILLRKSDSEPMDINRETVLLHFFSLCNSFCKRKGISCAGAKYTINGVIFSRADLKINGKCILPDYPFLIPSQAVTVVNAK
ncbi:hypothetical protein COW98_03240 [Candidatus Roizmanbacteria bacterium CG22_combo_CG10-13_8_21_14_all_35_9]|uniref:Uncharacterized protein n=3 Tax=Candidatus Roizmaniibacteriota TaxID=1752723 RepID=A0A2H0BY86_9BACT|nr:MAG: hypothetical protein COX47_01530 [Candidatus Roizmanbacteria bacterium CG23_combo_of_CG06-09_8_20_14_all_35_49]PIP62581.1 MAG: hypothetical protein COW98_03240 [Candidatus Roizmanbacteria bacterium CG22_combo_CG10-13_8_21_14_all_35_9]PIY71082.1 MAG: hypothetical protein COY88_02250 [Candidatus Roizmanbacteria bacterium CG_4_10_14_0_8_um_filter_35_28]